MPAFVQDVANGTAAANATTLVLTPSVSTTQGNTLILWMRGSNGALAASVTDTQGNTWTVDVSGGSGATQNICSAYLATALTPSDTITVTISPVSANACQAAVAEFSGIAQTGRTDQAPAPVHSATTSVTVATGTASAQASELVFSACSGSTLTTFTITSPDPDSGNAWTALGYPAGSYQEAAAYQVAAAASLFSASWTAAGGTNTTAAIVTYKAAAGAPGQVSSADSASGSETGVISQDGSVKTYWRKSVQPAGGGTMNVIDISADGRIAAGTDTQGALVSSDGGDHWYERSAGLGAGGPCGAGTSAPEVANPHYWFQFACVAWSTTEPDTVYGCVGDAGAFGGFVASTDGMATWSMRSTVPQFAGNQATGTSGAFPRSTGRLVAQDGTYLWAGTDNQGILRSAAGPGQQAGADGFPVTCTMAGSAPGSTYWCRSLVYDSARNYLWAGFYNSGLWVCTNPQAVTPNFTQVAGSPTTVEEIAVLGGYVYCAAASSGIWQYNVAGAAWASLNGSTVDTATSVWEGVDAVAVSGSHVVAITCSSPVSGASFIKLTIASAGAGAVTYQVMSASSLDNNDLPPDNQALFLETTTLVLGGAQSKNNFVRFDPADATGSRIYVAGSNGFYRSTDGGSTWVNARNGWGGFHVWTVACNPAHDGHLVFGSTDYGAFDVTDGLGWTAGAITNDSPGGMARVLTFDPVDYTVYAGYCTKGTVNSGGGAAFRPWNAPSSWTDLALGTHVASYAPTGMSAFRDASGAKVLVAAVQAHGIWRWTSAGGWVQVSSAAMTATQVAYTGMDYAGSGVVFCFDRAQGLYRSTDYGQTWSLAWTGTATSDFTVGSVSVNPAVSGEVWVSADDALYKLSGANSGTPTPTKITASAVSANGPVKCGKDGTVYCASRDAGTGMSLWKTLDGGTTWTNLDPDRSFAMSSSYPFAIDISAAGRVYVAGNNLLTLPSGVATGSADSAHAVEGGSVQAGGTAKSGSDSGHGTEAASVHVTLATGDTGHGLEAGSVSQGSTPKASADTGHGTDSSSVHATLAGADTGHAAEAGTARSSTSPSSSDHGLATESAFYYHAGGDSRPAAAEGFTVRVSGADSASGADRPLKSWPTARDAASAADAPLKAWPSKGDTGHAAESVRPFPAASADTGHGSDSLHEIGIWTYVPSGVRLLLKGKYRPGKPRAQLAAEHARLTAAVLRLVTGGNWVQATVRVTGKDRAGTSEAGQIPHRWGD